MANERPASVSRSGWPDRSCNRRDPGRRAAGICVEGAQQAPAAGPPVGAGMEPRAGRNLAPDEISSVNRRMRARMSGDVRGGPGRPALLLDSTGRPPPGRSSVRGRWRTGFEGRLVQAQGAIAEVGPVCHVGERHQRRYRRRHCRPVDEDETRAATARKAPAPMLTLVSTTPGVWRSGTRCMLISNRLVSGPAGRGQGGMSSPWFVKHR